MRRRSMCPGMQAPQTVLEPPDLAVNRAAQTEASGHQCPAALPNSCSLALRPSTLSMRAVQIIVEPAGMGAL